MVKCPICGPKLSICCSLLSMWGIVMLGLLGVFYKIHSVALFEDIPLTAEKWKKENYTMSIIYEKYDQTAYNCFIAAGIYILCFIFSCCQQRMNSKASYEMS
ncbi:ribonuclease kappa-A-like [Ostrea edulis]|uniref:ribonuclease kappa-A-like n=1 Tax=Ostrea edulis TaxID=37623 RepID=UPI002094535F|nr:ribonuclease kappa-A-like [Ostrea edulis]